MKIKKLSIDFGECSKIIIMLKHISSIYGLDIPEHWSL